MAKTRRSANTARLKRRQTANLDHPPLYRRPNKQRPIRSIDHAELTLTLLHEECQELRCLERASSAAFVEAGQEVARNHLRISKQAVALQTVQRAYLQALHRAALLRRLIHFEITLTDFLQGSRLGQQETMAQFLRSLFGAVCVVSRTGTVNVAFMQQPPSLQLRTAAASAPHQPRARKAATRASSGRAHAPQDLPVPLQPTRPAARPPAATGTAAVPEAVRAALPGAERQSARPAAGPPGGPAPALDAAETRPDTRSGKRRRAAAAAAAVAAAGGSGSSYAAASAASAASGSTAPRAAEASSRAAAAGGGAEGAAAAGQAAGQAAAGLGKRRAAPGTTGGPSGQGLPQAKKARQRPPNPPQDPPQDTSEDNLLAVVLQDDLYLTATAALLHYATITPPELLATANEHKETLLHWAAARGCIYAVQAILEKGALPDCFDCQGNTPLHYATAGGHLEAAKKLLEYGANALLRNHKGLQAVHYAPCSFARCLRNGRPVHFPLQIIYNTLGPATGDRVAAALLPVCRSLSRDARAFLTRFSDNCDPGAPRRLQLALMLPRYPAANTLTRKEGWDAADLLQLSLANGWDAAALIHGVRRPRIKSLRLRFVTPVEPLQYSVQLDFLTHVTALTLHCCKGHDCLAAFRNPSRAFPPSLCALHLSNLGEATDPLLDNLAVQPLPQLHTLKLKSLPLHSDSLVSLACTHAGLTRVEISHCRELEYLTPLLYLSGLRHLSIRQCPKAQFLDAAEAAAYLGQAGLRLGAWLGLPDALPLETVHIRGALRRFQDIGPLLSLAPHLRKLAVEDCEFYPVKKSHPASLLQHGLHHLPSLTALEYASFSGAGLRIQLMGHLAPLARLSALDLRGCSLPPKMVPQLALLPTLRALNLAHWDVCRRLLPEAAKQLTMLTQLRHLGLRKQRLVPWFPIETRGAGGAEAHARLLRVARKYNVAFFNARRKLVGALRRLMGGVQGGGGGTLEWVDVSGWSRQDVEVLEAALGGPPRKQRWRRVEVLYDL